MTKTLSEEHKRNIGLAQLGEKNHAYGKHHSEEHKLKISMKLKGRKKSPSHIQKMIGHTVSETTRKKLSLHTGAKRWNWKGDNVDKGPALHNWVRRNLKQPEKCEKCQRNKSYDLANITGTYSRDFNNWMYLCRSCHCKLDNIVRNFGKYSTIRNA